MPYQIYKRLRYVTGRHLIICRKTGRLMTGRLRLLPDFMIIGAQKSGTTSLFRLLKKHPNIIPAARKEVHYFDNMNSNFRNGMNWYRAHFPTLFNRYFRRWIHHQNIITGEASPYYIFHPLVPERIFETVPKVKLIAILRDPVARAYSHYHHNVRKGYESLTFEQAIDQEKERIQTEVEKLRNDRNYFSFNHAHYSYLSRGIYVQQLINWHRYFPKEQLLVIRSEDYFSDPPGVYRQILEFLGLPNWYIDQPSKYNESARYPDMDSKTKKQLTEYFRPHNERLNEYLGVDLGWDA